MTWRGHLAGDGDERHRVHLGVGQAGDEVERPGARGGHHHARLAGGAGISLGREDAPLLVPRQDRPDPVAVPGQRLVHRHARPARIGEETSTPCRTSDSTRTSAPVIGLRRGLGQGLAIVDGGHGGSSLPDAMSAVSSVVGHS